MKRIKSAAIKGPAGVVTKPPPAHHINVAKHAHATVGTGKGKRGFVTTGGEFVGREAAAKIAHAAGQAPKVKKLHSENIFGKKRKT